MTTRTALGHLATGVAALAVVDVVVVGVLILAFLGTELLGGAARDAVESTPSMTVTGPAADPGVSTSSWGGAAMVMASCTWSFLVATGIAERRRGPA